MLVHVHGGAQAHEAEYEYVYWKVCAPRTDHSAIVARAKRSEPLPSRRLLPHSADRWPPGTDPDTICVVLKLGRIELGAVPRIAVPLSDLELRAHGAAVKAVADIFELRIDQFQRHDPEYVAAVCREARSHKVPLIATVRAAAEGGKVKLPDAHRLAIFKAVAPIVDALDIEFHTPIRDEVTIQAHVHHRLAIVSYHDFKRTPLDRDLIAIIDVAKRHSADIVKLAVTALTSLDTDRLLSVLVTHRTKQLIAIAMGPYGIMSRVFFPIAGSLITYGFLNQPNAPGQLSAVELANELRRYSPDFRHHHPG